jgi:hypothetical protein
VAVGMVLTFLVDRRASDNGQRGRTTCFRAEANDARQLDLRGPRRVQVGDGNVQRNVFGREWGWRHRSARRAAIMTGAL